MRRQGWPLMAAALLTVIVTSPVLAAGPLSLGIGGGVTMPVGDSGDVLKNGFHLRGIAELKVPALPVGLRTALGYQKLNLDDLAAAAGYANGESKILSGLLGFTLPLMSTGPVRPYVTASLGAFHVTGQADSSGTTLSHSGTQFGIDGGIGVKLGLGRANGFVEARMENVYTDQGWNPAVSSIKNARFIPVTFGLSF